MNEGQRIIKRLDSYVSAADIFKVYENEPGIAFLDSSLVNKLGHYSVIGRCPYLKLVKDGAAFTVNGRGETEATFEEYMRQYLAKHADYNHCGLPIVSGAIGYISYDYGMSRMEMSSRLDDMVSVPEAVMTFYDCFIVEDCWEKETYLVANGVMGEAASEIESMEKAIKRLSTEAQSVRPAAEKSFVIAENKTDVEKSAFDINVHADCDKSEYESNIKIMKEYITEGDIYVANMTRQLVIDSYKKPLDVFHELRSSNPSPFGGYLDFEDYQVVCASPERFLQVKDRHVMTRPIKGTRRRGETAREDEAARRELEGSKKEKSELLMIVDLERNDLNRVCIPGSVKVSELFAIEDYATVFHQVANVEGELSENEDVMTLLDAAFPGGSITGAPKRRAMEIIDGLEQKKRNIYTGAIGYIALNGDCDFNIVIRTLLHKDGRYYLGVGGGITSESDPEAEYEETWDKAIALLRALR